MRLFGQTFTAEIIERIRAVVREEATLSRSALSRRVCRWLDWQDTNGKPKEVSSRQALVELERRGVIGLPEAQRMVPQARCAAPLEPFPALVYQRMLASHHPLGGGALWGAQQRYLIRSPRLGWLGALAFSAAAWQLAARDDWIGWCPQARRANLSRVVANSRFLLLPNLAVANLGSHVLALAARRVVVDWRRRYGYAPVLLETFVDESCFAGTVYKAANGQRLGVSAGRGRQDRDNRAALGAKGLYVLPLQRDWRSVLCRCCACRRRMLSSLGSRRNSHAWISPTHACARACWVWHRHFPNSPSRRSPGPCTQTPARAKPLIASSRIPKWTCKPCFIPTTRPRPDASGRIRWCWSRRRPPASTTTPMRTRTAWGRSIPAPMGRRGSSCTIPWR
jgi:hypothetical protein